MGGGQIAGPWNNVMRVLAVTTSTSAQGVCLRRPDVADAITRLDYKRGEPRQLTRAIWQLLADAELQPADLDLLICDVGPGSFTGLRLGLATVRAIAWAAAVPAVGVGSLEAMLAAAATSADADGPWLAVLPSRRGVIYAGLGNSTGCWRAAEVAVADLAAWCTGGAQPHAAPQGLVGPPVALEAAAAALPGHLAHRPQAGPEIEWICALGMAAAARGPRDQAVALQPRYLAVSEAERAARVALSGGTLRAPATH